MDNETSQFLGADYQWYSTTIALDDVQALLGGIRLTVKGNGRVEFTIVEPGRRKRAYRSYLKSSETQNLKALLVEQDFLTIAPEERPGVPDEARPTITLRNAAGKTHRVAKWAGVKDDRFDAIYKALQQLAAEAQARFPLLLSEPKWWKKAKIIIAIGLAVATVVLAQQLVRSFLTAWGAVQEPTALILPVLLLTGLIPVLLLLAVLLEWWVHGCKSFFPRDASFILQLIGIGYYVSLWFVAPFLVEAQMSTWGKPTIAVIEQKYSRFDYDSDLGVTNTYYYLKYRYEIPTGKSYTGRAGVKPRYYQSVNEGDEVTVYYLPKIPRWSALDAVRSASSRAPVLFTTLLTLIGWIGLFCILTYGLFPLMTRILKSA